MKITYNGTLLDISATNLEALILQQAGTDQGVAVALDGAVVSRAVRHPAVLGRGAILSLVRSGKMGVPEACLRIATVVISVPDATKAFSSRSMLVAPPEPIMSRDENSFSAIIMASTRPELRSAHRP